MDKYRIVEYKENEKSIFKVEKLAKIPIRKFIFFAGIKEEWQEVSLGGRSKEELKYHKESYSILPSFTTLEKAKEKILEFTVTKIIHNID